MKKIIITTALLTAAAPSLVAGKLSMEEHTMQAVLQMQQAQEKNGPPEFVTVGDDVECTHRLGTTRIQDAIDDGFASEIRIASSTYNENLVINDKNITLIGGYNSCADAVTGVSNGELQVISGGGAASPTLRIGGQMQSNTVNLESLTFQDGQGSGFDFGGGISTLAANVALNLTNVNIVSNTGIKGGGLAVLGGNTDVTIDNVLISNNTADEGGGIYCSGNQASIVVNASDPAELIKGVFNNTATNGDGGGALIESECELFSFNGRSDTLFDLKGFGTNKATENGGGIAVKSGGLVYLNGGLVCFNIDNCLGDNTRPVNVNFNSADSDENGTGLGGGIYATGDGTTVELFNTVIKNNKAYAGGGILAENQATVNMRSLYTLGSCWEKGACSQLINNKTADTGGVAIRGGGLYATTGAVVDISNTLISGNRANAGTAIYTLAENGDEALTSLDVEGSLIVNNGADGADGWTDIDTIRVNGGDVKLDYNTIADNDADDDSANIHYSSNGVDDELSLFASIIHNFDNLDVYQGPDLGTQPVGCLIVNDINSLPAEDGISLDDPGFINRDGGDFHLNAAVSPAIDFCNLSSTPDFNDSDNEVRGFDDPLMVNDPGTYDVGYDETYQNDIIFENGFEENVIL